MSRENVEVVMRVAAAFSDGDFETSFALLDPEVRLYPRSEEPGVEDVYHGHEGIFEWAVNWYSQWDEYEVEPVKLQDAPEEQVLVVFQERGCMEQMGITVEQEFSHSFIVRDGKIVEWRQYDSHQEALEAVGLRE